ncbi:virion RNA polymerase [Sulfitobacter phage phiCB2047-B]|uniref:Virion RNA polymerase n=1 Tax=Sulfitobacter phage phiCB2047-B TaxID=754046 RepID=M4PMR4_9CAUD|nr:virion RNA polymerase [Sulfitobacter phage phiCB2047-B]AGH07392.1 virion RNA polymerase [Sulfitobacter phage phiCB2047-B]
MADNNRSTSIIDEAFAKLANMQSQDTGMSPQQTPQDREALIVSNERGNDLTEEGLNKDLFELSNDQIMTKYGREVADNQLKLQAQAQETKRMREKDRTFGEVLGDSFNSYVGAGVSSIANTSGAVIAGLDSMRKGGTFSEGAVDMAEFGADFSNYARDQRSQTLKDRERLIGVEAALDKADSKADRDAYVKAGGNEFIADMQRLGRDIIDTGGRALADGAVTGDIVSSGVGSLLPSAAMASSGASLLSGATGIISRGAVAQRVAAATGSSIGAGASEAGGTYADTVNEVLDMKEEDLSNSDVYKALLQDNDNDVTKTRREFAGLMGETAFKRQLPTAMAIGFISSKFNAAPLGAFKNSSVAEGIRKIAGEGLEESLQGATSQLNQNELFQDVDGRDLLDDVGEQAVQGAIGGIGQSSATGGASAALSGAKTAVESVTNGDPSDEFGKAVNTVKTTTQNTSKIINDLVGSDTTKEGVQSVKQMVTSVKDKTANNKTITSAITKASPTVDKVSAPVKRMAAPIMQAIKDRANGVDVKANTENLTNLRNMTAAAQKAVEVGDTTPEFETALNIPDTTPAPADTVQESGSLLQNAVEISQKFSSTGFAPSDSQKAYAVAQLTKLSSMASSLPAGVRTGVQKIMDSPVTKKLQEDVKKIDQNKKDPVTEITPDVVSETVSLARLNPANVNPDTVDKILKQSGDNLSDEDVRVMQAASKISSLVNNHADVNVAISKDQGIALEKVGLKGQKVPEPDTSRSIQVEGYTSGAKKLRSITDFASDIMKGAQAADGKVANADGVPVPVEKVMQEFSNFVEHMNNKVGALNESFKMNSSKGTGPRVSFRGLVSATRFVDSDKWNNPVFYHRRNPAAVANARNVENDLDVAVQVYNEIRSLYPELLGSFPEATKTDLLKDEGGFVELDTLAAEIEAQEASERDATERDAELRVEQGEVLDASQSLIEGDEVTSTTVEEAEITEPDTQASDEIAQVVEENQVTEEVVNTPAERKVRPEFDKLYNENTDNAVATNLDGYLVEAEKANLNPETLSIAKSLIRPLVDKMNERVQNKSLSLNGKMTKLIDALKDSKFVPFRQYRNTYVVDPETGLYDKDLVEMAGLALVDWIASVPKPNPKDLMKFVTDLGFDYDTMSNEDLDVFRNGIPANMVKTTIANDILRMWNLRENIDSPMALTKGVVESLVSEMLETMNQNNDLSVNLNLETFTADKNTQVFLMIDGLDELQDKIHAESVGKKTTVKEALFDADPARYSIGTPISGKARSKKKNLSNLEKDTAQNMQDTPHYLDEGKASFMEDLGEAVYDLLGYRDDIADDPSIIVNSQLRKSLVGKNNGIFRLIKETADMLGILDAGVPVFYPVGTSRVGRQMYQGPNPQNNKLLRMIVTPTWSDPISYADKKGMSYFWLAAAQAAGMKIEKKSMNTALNSAESFFMDKYSDSVDVIQKWMDGDGLDSDALVSQLGVIEPQLLSALVSVAQMKTEQALGNESFTTSLSFELDGVTNGVANMMVHFGQGMITPEDYKNFNSVGLFFGKIGATLNDYFSVGNKDMYEKSTSQSQKSLYRTKGKDRETAIAIGNFGALFGNFEKLEQEVNGFAFELTRNTSKQPMTALSYGAGVGSISENNARDMMNGFYAKIEGIPKGTDLGTYFGYPSIYDDIQTLFGVNLKGVDLQQGGYTFPAQKAATFTMNVKEVLGKTLEKSTEAVIGSKVIELKDTMVLATNVQSNYQRLAYEAAIERIAQEKVKAGTLRSTTNSKTKVVTPIYSELTNRDFAKARKEAEQFAPIFVSEDQNIAVGGFENAASPFVISSSMDETMNQKTSMLQPVEAGVKSVAYTIQGSGDAMMMNLIFGADNYPQDAINIWDGFDIPVSKIEEYSSLANERVLQSWDRDVVGMFAHNYEQFAKNADADLLAQAFSEATENAKKPHLNFKTPAALKENIDKRYAENKARKAALKDSPLSVDQMAGGGVGYSRGEGEKSLSQINFEIKQRIEGKDTAVKDDVKTPILVSNVDAVLGSLRLNTEQKSIVSVLKEYLPNVRVVVGTVSQLNEYRQNNFPDDGQTLENVPGMYDVANETIFLTSTAKVETVLHEMVHAGTYKSVLDHFTGDVPSDAVVRLDALMTEFMNTPFKGDRVNEAKGAILQQQASNDAKSKAAALNEFMAYALSNNQVRSVLKSTETSLLKTLSQKVIQLMKRIMGNKVPTSMYDHVVFNVKVLNEAPIDDTPDDGGNGDNNNGDTPNEAVPESEENSNFWIDMLAEDSSDVWAEAQKHAVSAKPTTTSYNNADAVLDDLRESGLIKTNDDRRTFKAIYILLSSDRKLNSNAVIALTKVYQYIEENMSPDMFGSNSQANQTYQAVMNAFGKRKNADGISDAMTVLLALSQTSENFRKVLDQIPEPTGDQQIDGTLRDFTRNLAIAGMNSVTQNIRTNDKNLTETLNDLAGSMIKLDQEEEYGFLSRITGSFAKGDAYVSGKFSELSNYSKEKNEQIKNESNSKFLKVISNVFTTGTNLLDKDNSALVGASVQRATMDALIPIREMVYEITGSKKEFKELLSLRNVVSSKVSGMRQAYREGMPKFILEMFSTDLEPEQLASLHYTLGRTDITSFLDVNNMQSGMNMLEFTDKRVKRIQELEATLDANYVQYVAQDAKDKAEQLARFINKEGAGTLLMRNAYAIAKNLDGDFNSDMVEVIDELTTLYALDQMPSDIKEETVQLWQNEPEAVRGLVSLIQGLNEGEENKEGITEKARLNAYKGYIPNTGDSNVQIVIEDDSEKHEMERRGFTQVKPFTGFIGSTSPKSYYVTTTKQGGIYSQGIMQNVQSTYRGVDINTGMTVTNETSGYYSDDSTVSYLLEQYNETGFALDDDMETLLPVFDDDGAVIAFERAINPILHETLMNQTSDVSTQIGAWAGRQVEEQLATNYNRALVDRLRDLYENREVGSDSEFVNLKKTKDPIYREAFQLIPKGIKEYIDEKFQGEGFIVPVTMVNTAVGYREASLADMWSGKTRLPQPVQDAVVGVSQLFMGNAAMKRLTVAETALQGVVSSAREIIIVRSLVVPAANLKSNVIQLANAGVPAKSINQGFRAKLGEIEEHNRNVEKLMKLEAQERLYAKNQNQKRIIQKKIQSIKDLNSRMSIAPMIEAGMYTQLSEGLTDLDTQISKGKVGDVIEGLANKLPDKLSSIANVGLVSKSTAIYKVANRATQYGDFLAKSIMYDHLIKKGLSNEDAIKVITEEFVNFVEAPGRVRSGLESSGLTWFWTFKIKIARIALKQLRDNPVSSLAVNGLMPDVGTPLQDNIFSVIGKGNLGYSTGYEMLFNAPEMNPFVSLLTD